MGIQQPTFHKLNPLHGVNMLTLTKEQTSQVSGAGLVQVLVDVITGKTGGSTNVSVKAPLTSVLVNVVWGKK
jgi:hypothetical protein